MTAAARQHNDHQPANMVCVEMGNRVSDESLTAAHPAGGNEIWRRAIRRWGQRSAWVLGNAGECCCLQPGRPASNQEARAAQRAGPGGSHTATAAGTGTQCTRRRGDGGGGHQYTRQTAEYVFAEAGARSHGKIRMGARADIGRPVGRRGQVVADLSAWG